MAIVFPQYRYAAYFWRKDTTNFIKKHSSHLLVQSLSSHNKIIIWQFQESLAPFKQCTLEKKNSLQVLVSYFSMYTELLVWY